jgi:hypothetical protein
VWQAASVYLKKLSLHNHRGQLLEGIIIRRPHFTRTPVYRNMYESADVSRIPTPKKERKKIKPTSRILS